MPTPVTKIKNRDLVPTFTGIATIGKFPPGLVSLKVAKIIAALTPEARTFQAEESRLIEEYAARDEEGAPKTQVSQDGERVTFVLDPARRHEYVEKHNELMDEEVEIHAPRLTQEELESVAKKTSLDPHAASYLLTFVDPPAEPQQES